VLSKNFNPYARYILLSQKNLLYVQHTLDHFLMSVLSHCDLLMISDRYYSSRSIASITLTSRAFESETWSRLPPWDPRQRGTSREDPTSGPPRADGFRRRVKRGKEGLGCVSLPPSGAHLPSPQQSRTVRSGQEPRR